MAVVHIKTSSKNRENTGENEISGSKIHHMPCTIKSNGEANVSKYFEPLIREESPELLLNSFRGYPLMGRELQLPEGYSGYVLQEPNSKINEETDRTVYVQDEFCRLTYWNYDKFPSVNDKICNAINWISIANVIHKPTESQEEK